MEEKRTVKIFAVSDIHGCVRDLKRALMQAGFYPNSPKHLLVICGDNFDRGKENAATFAYLRTVKNKIMIRGNHEDILTEALERGFITKSDEHNGTLQTVEEFFGASSIDFFKRLSIPEGAKKELTDFIDGMYDYFETEEHIFTHGWTPRAIEGVENWRKATLKDWQEARWKCWDRLYPTVTEVEEKTVVVGHSSAKYARNFDSTRDWYDTSTFKTEKMIAIDGSVYETEKINVYICESTLLPTAEYTVAVTEPTYNEIKKNPVNLIRVSTDIPTLRPCDTAILNCENSDLPPIKTTVCGVYQYKNETELSASHKNQMLHTTLPRSSDNEHVTVIRLSTAE